MGLHEHLFSFSVKTDVESINPDVLFHTGQAVGCRREGQQWATAVFIGRAACCSWHGASAVQGKWLKGIGPGDLKE